MSSGMRWVGEYVLNWVQSYLLLVNLIYSTEWARFFIVIVFRADSFVQNYLLTTEFLTRLESMCPSLDHLNTLRSHPTMTTFLKRWQLPVYYQLRFGEIVKLVEKGLESVTSSIASPDASLTDNENDNDTGRWEMKGSQSIWTALERCWSEKVWLPELSFRFWKLSLQVSLSFRRSWLIALDIDVFQHI